MSIQKTGREGTVAARLRRKLEQRGKENEKAPPKTNKPKPTKTSAPAGKVEKIVNDNAEIAKMSPISITAAALASARVAVAALVTKMDSAPVKNEGPNLPPLLTSRSVPHHTGNEPCHCGLLSGSWTKQETLPLRWSGNDKAEYWLNDSTDEEWAKPDSFKNSFALKVFEGTKHMCKSMVDKTLADYEERMTYRYRITKATEALAHESVTADNGKSSEQLRKHFQKQEKLIKCIFSPVKMQTVKKIGREYTERPVTVDAKTMNKIVQENPQLIQLAEHQDDASKNSMSQDQLILKSLEGLQYMKILLPPATDPKANKVQTAKPTANDITTRITASELHDALEKVCTNDTNDEPKTSNETGQGQTDVLPLSLDPNGEKNAVRVDTEAEQSTLLKDILRTCALLLKMERQKNPELNTEKDTANNSSTIPWSYLETMSSYDFEKDSRVHYYQYPFQCTVMMDMIPDLDVMHMLFKGKSFNTEYDPNSGRKLYIYNEMTMVDMVVNSNGQVTFECPNSANALAAVKQLFFELHKAGCPTSMNMLSNCTVRAALILPHEVDLNRLSDCYACHTFYRPQARPHLVFQLPLSAPIFVVLQCGIMLVLKVDDLDILRQSICLMMRVAYTCRGKTKTLGKNEEAAENQLMESWRKRLNEDNENVILFAKGG